VSFRVDPEGPSPSARPTGTSLHPGGARIPPGPRPGVGPRSTRPPWPLLTLAALAACHAPPPTTPPPPPSPSASPSASASPSPSPSASASASASPSASASASASPSPPPAPPPSLPPAPTTEGDDGLAGGDLIREGGPPNRVAFTFDDGPSLHHTPAVLAALAAHDVPATFFVVGKELTRGHPDQRRALLRRVADAGHDIGNHTFGHVRLSAIRPAAAARDIERGADAIADAIGRHPTMLRPPYGARTPSLVRRLAQQRTTVVLWTIDPEDWTEPDAATLRRAVVARILADRGGIVVLHDTKRTTAAALPGILADLEVANCARLAAGAEPILPVSLHYFIRDQGVPRPIPRPIAERTERYRDGLLRRCGVVKTTPVSNVDNHNVPH